LKFHAKIIKNFRSIQGFYCGLALVIDILYLGLDYNIFFFIFPFV